MHALVAVDVTERTIAVAVQQGTAPDLDVTEPWHRKPRVIRPDYVTVKSTNGETHTIKVSGGLVLKSGEASASVRDSKRWTPRTIELAPEWVQTIAREAPLGVTDWTENNA